MSLHHVSILFRLASVTAAMLFCATTPAAVREAVSTPHAWSYQGEAGPRHWGDLDAADTTCKAGRAQSPIDIPPAAAPHHVHQTEFHYGAVPVELVNNGHTVEAELADPGSAPWIVIDGRRFALAQFHFHHPSEHTVAGQRFPMEMHLVHKSEDGRLAVVAVFIREGALNRPMQAAFAHLPGAPAGAGAEPHKPLEIALSDLLPGRHDAWMYQGSLTTPPCTEGVQWIVLKQPISFSKAQIAHFAKLFPDNHRPAQALDDRQVD
jgi:carbonic anhydrase